MFIPSHHLKHLLNEITGSQSGIRAQIACMRRMRRTVAAICTFSALLGRAAPSAIDVAVDEKKRLNHVVDSTDLLLYVLLASECRFVDC